MPDGKKHCLQPCRFNAIHFIESFQVKCSWKLSKLTESAEMAANELYPLTESFRLDFEGDVRDSDLSSWQIIHSFQLV